MATGPADKALVAQSMLNEAPALSDWLVVTPVIIPFVFAAIIVMQRQRVDRHGPIAIAGFVLLVLCNIGLVNAVRSDGVIVMAMSNWIPPFGISFTVDIVSALFALVASVIGLLTAIFADGDLDMRSRRYGFFAFLLLLVAGVSGAFLTGDVFNLYVWFEVLLIASFGLIVYGGGREQLDGAVRYAILNLLATTFFLIATGLLYGMTGTLNFADIARKVPELTAGAPTAAVASLFILAFAMKAAAFPLNFWLPASYHTPPAVVGALFAGLLTKVGVYALFRITSLVFPTPPAIIDTVVMAVAVATMVIGVLGALAQNDIRRVMGFLVVSGIGSMLLGIALGTTEALMGAIIYAVHSMIVMTALYLAVDLIQKATARFRLTELGGLYAVAPLLSTLFLVLAFAVSGLPPFSGLWPKIVLLRASLAVDAHWAAFAILLTGILTSITMGRVWALTFWRPRSEGAPEIDTAMLQDRRLMAPLIALVALTVGIGLFPAPLFELAGLGAAGLTDPSEYIRAVFDLAAHVGVAEQ